MFSRDEIRTGIIIVTVMLVIFGAIPACVKYTDNIGETNSQAGFTERVDTINLTQSEIKSYTDKIDSLENVINDIQIDIHNYQHYTDSIADELLVAQYKLERIGYYNNIAKKGNNIKFFRGWVQRVLTE